MNNFSSQGTQSSLKPHLPRGIDIWTCWSTVLLVRPVCLWKSLTLPRTPVVSGKGKGKAALGATLALPEVDTPSPPCMEALMTDPTLFKEPLLKDPEEVTTAMGSVYRAPVIKKVLDLLRESTPFQVVVVVTPCPYICSFFSLYSSLLLMDFFPFTFGLLCK